MKYAELLLWAVLGVLIAVAVERLIAHFCRRADDDISRLDAAMEAMRDQQESLDALLARESVPELVKEWLIVFAEAALTKSGAYALFRRVTGVIGEEPDIPKEVQLKIDDFVAATNRMRDRDPEAYEIYRTFIYRIPILAFLQRPETYKAMGQLSLRLAEEREPAAANDAALMTQGSRLPAAA
jgi:hypothetical protein